MSFPKFVYMIKTTPFSNFARFWTPKRYTRVQCLVLKNNLNYVNFLDEPDTPLDIRVAPRGAGFQGASPPDPHQGLGPLYPRWGSHPQTPILVYVPTCIHLFPHARTDTIQVVEHEPNFSKFYPLAISFLVSQFCTLESSLCVSSSDYYLISPFGSSLINVVLDHKFRTTECTHQTTSVHKMSS